MSFTLRGISILCQANIALLQSPPVSKPAPDKTVAVDATGVDGLEWATRMDEGAFACHDNSIPCKHAHIPTAITAIVPAVPISRVVAPIVAAASAATATRREEAPAAPSAPELLHARHVGAFGKDLHIHEETSQVDSI